jgi:hypothetical protein
MKVQIIGLNHQIQSRTLGCLGAEAQAFERNQKDRFTELLRERMREHGITLVCEEAFPGQMSLAEAVCEADQCAYCNIEMSREERLRHGIPDRYAENPAVPQAEQDRCNAARESQMIARILETGQGHENVMVLCGRMHSESLAAQLRQADHEVEIDDLMNQPWYVEDWIEYIMEHF